MAVTIMLDAGHGGWNGGAVYEGRQEKDDVLRLTLAVGELLREAGVTVIYTRETDQYRSPGARAGEANAADVDFFLSIHRNSSPYPGQYSGVESLVYERRSIAGELGGNINRRLQGAGFVDLGVNERKGLIVLNRTAMPAVLIEVGFINTPTDNYLFDARFSEIARAIADGILETVRAE